MADNQQFDDLRKQAERLNKQLESLGGTAAKNLDDFINGFGGGIDGASKAINNLRDQINGLDTDINYLADSLRKVTKELSGQTTSNKEIEKSYRKLSSLANQLYNDQNQINVLSEKELISLNKKINLEKGILSKALQDNIDSQIEISNQIEKNEGLEEKLRKKLEDKGRLTKKEQEQYKKITDELTKQRALQDKTFANNEEAEKFLQDEILGFELLVKASQNRLAEEQKINRTLGASGKIVDGIIGSLGKLGISSDFFENVKEDMREAAKSGDKWKVVTTATKGLMSGIGDALKDPVAQLMLAKKAFEFFLNAAVNANKESVNLSKNLGYGAAGADRVRANFVSIEGSTNNLNVTTKNLSEAFNELSEATGFVTEYSADALTTQIKLTKQLGLTGDEAAGVYKFSVLTGKSSEATYQSMLKGYVATRNSLGVGVPFKAAIAEASKVSGQLASNLGNNPEAIIKGVVAAKALGTSLEQAKQQGESLLDFQSSIENELKAELITGQQLNLERARAAALMGDQVAVAEELAAQGMTAEKFSKLNVVAQNSYAQALGTTSDELANQLAKREMAIASGKSLAQITAEEADEAAKRQDIQTKFNAAMEKLQSIIGNLVAGPLGTMLEMLSGALDLVNLILYPVTAVLGMFGSIGSAIGGLIPELGVVGKILKGIAGIAVVWAAYSTFAAVSAALAATIVGGLAAPIIGGLAAAAVLTMGMSALNADDMQQSGYGKRTILSPEGAIRLNDNDTVVAGTNLGGGSESESVKSSPSIDLTPMISAINEVTNAVHALNAKSWDVNLDGKLVGKGLLQKSHKSA